MIQLQAYLEYSDAATGSHKFHELTVEDNVVTVRFGRIGTAGQSQSQTYSSSEEALKAADKTIGEKLKKGYEHAVAGAREKQEVQRRPRIRFEEQLANLASCGISLKPGIPPELLMDEWDVKDYERDPYQLLLVALGSEIGEEECGFLSSNIWHFDTECIEDHGDYARIAYRMAELADGDLPLQRIEDYVDVEKQRAWLAFRIGWRRYKWTLEVDSDWVDTTRFSRFDSLLRSRNTQKRYTYLDLGGQDCIVGCATPAQLEKFRSTTGLDIKWMVE